jgi:hypothetical protein
MPPASNPFNSRYYLVLELPFDKLLVFKKIFSSLDDAEEVLDELPWFSLWDQQKYENCSSQKILIPLKNMDSKANEYKIAVNFTVAVQARDPYTAHRTVRNTLKKQLDAKDVTTYIEKTEELL